MYKIRCLIASLLSFATMMMACTKVDDSIATDFIPEGDIINFKIDTLTNFKFTTSKVDSIPTSTWGYGVCGSVVSPYYGKFEMSTLSTVLPYSGLSIDSIWGVEPTIDSANFVLAFASVMGSEAENQIFEFYQVEKHLPSLDSTTTYYSNFDVDNYISLANPLAKTIVSRTDSIYNIPIDIAHAERYLDTTNNVFHTDSLFLERFPGYYIRTAAASLATGTYRQLDLENCGIEIFYHNKNEVADTTSAFFSMYNSSYSSNICITTLENDLSYIDPVVGIDTMIIGKEDCDISYVVALGGLKTDLNLNKTYFEELQESAADQGYSHIAISNATLYIPLNNPTPYNVKQALYQIGSYKDYSNYVMVSDYSDYVASSDESSYGGTINPVTKEYSMDITQYVQLLLTGKEDDYEIELASALGTEHVLQGAALKSSEMRLVLNYYLVK